MCRCVDVYGCRCVCVFAVRAKRVLPHGASQEVRGPHDMYITPDTGQRGGDCGGGLRGQPHPLEMGWGGSGMMNFVEFLAGTRCIGVDV